MSPDSSYSTHRSRRSTCGSIRIAGDDLHHPGLPNENVDQCETFWEAAHARLTPPDVPLVVLSRSDPQGFAPAEFAAWTQSHRTLAASVSNGQQRTVFSANVIPEDAPADVANEIAAAVAEVGSR